MLGSSIAQFFLAPSNRFFKPWRINMFVTSIWLFVYGCAIEENLCHIPMFRVKSLKILQSNYFQLSRIRVLGIPKRQMFPHTMSTIFLVMILGMASASGHLEKYPTATTTNLFYLTVFGNDPSIFIPSQSVH